MKTYLLPKDGTFYKANLHCHTTLSDGHLTPEEMKAEYKKRGYAIQAFSDHNEFFCHNDMTDPDFLVLNAYEISIRDPQAEGPGVFRKNVDLGLIAKSPAITERIDHTVQTAPDTPYYPQAVNQMIRRADEAGFLVALNHPAWSLLNYTDYQTFDGLWAMEIYNHETYVDCAVQDMEWVYNDMLQSGKSLFCIANDDNHNARPVDSATSDSFGGFTFIKAKELTYQSVIEAMERGDMYASQGPEIFELYYEDGRIYIECSPAADICMCSLGRRGRRVVSPNGALLTKADFLVDPVQHGLVRFRVTDANGKKAFTRAFRVDEFMPDAEKHHQLP